jgi:hypothetical protein
MCWTLSMVTYSETRHVSILEWKGRETPTQLDHSELPYCYSIDHMSHLSIVYVNQYQIVYIGHKRK